MLEPGEVGENGHSTVLVSGDDLTLFYQSRVAGTNNRWRYGIARARLPLPEAA